MAKRKVNRSAITGRFVSKATAVRHPRTNVTETVSRPSAKKSGGKKK